MRNMNPMDRNQFSAIRWTLWYEVKELEANLSDKDFPPELWKVKLEAVRLHLLKLIDEIEDKEESLGRF
jgi:hypothetical protein